MKDFVTENPQALVRVAIFIVLGAIAHFGFEVQVNEQEAIGVVITMICSFIIGKKLAISKSDRQLLEKTKEELISENVHKN